MDRKDKRENWWLIYFFAALFVLFVGFWWLNAINATPEIKIENPKAPNPNAYDYYLSAANSIVDEKKVSNAAYNRSKSWKGTTSWPDDRYYSSAEKEILLKKNTAILKTLRDGFEYEYLDPADWKPYSWSDSSHYSKFRNLGRLIKLESDIYAKKGDYKSAVNSVIDGFHFGTDIYKGGKILGSLVGAALENIIRKDSMDYADHLSAKDAKLAAKKLENILNQKYTFANVYECEKRYGLKFLSYTFNQKGWRKDFSTKEDDIFGLTPKPSNYERGSLFIRAYTVSKRKVFENYLNAMDIAIEICKKPYSAKPNDLPTPNDPVNELIAFPLLRKAQINYERTSVMEKFFLLQLVLRAYKLENNKYPNSLNDLTQKYLTKVPVDPFGGGKTFVYKRTGDKFILYSLGPDCNDDGGKAITDNYIRQTSKGDIVLGVNKRI